jgi:hypothetical protein
MNEDIGITLMANTERHSINSDECQVCLKNCNIRVTSSYDKYPAGLVYNHGQDTNLTVYSICSEKCHKKFHEYMEYQKLLNKDNSQFVAIQYA